MARTPGTRACPEEARTRRRFARTSSAGLAAVVLFSLVGPSGALAGTGSDGGSTAPLCGRPVLDDPAGGTEAIRELGTDLAAAAKRIDKSPAEFRSLLRDDSTVQVDQCGATFVVEPEVSQSATAPTGGDTIEGDGDLTPAAGGLDATGDAFALSSRPGSARTIYLDFNGERIVGTEWNTSAGVADFTAPPFDRDGAPGSFNTAESDIVRGVWQRVAEDYAPFDVNVTTADPGAAAITRSGISDPVYGTRALITPDPVVYTNVCNQQCGGVAYLNAFDRPSGHATTQPAFIFSQALQPTAKSIAEAVSHEVGHNLGLDHDGRGSDPYYAGHTPWAPIMGVGYSQPISQWSKGEYNGADNPEDDFVVIAANGAPITADDFSDSLGAAAPLAANTAVHGVIATRTDVDAFTFIVPVGAETTTVKANPASVGADLDIVLKVYDEAGNLLETADPPPVRTNSAAATGLDAMVARILAPGTYVATVDGTSWSTPAAGYTDYASLGNYTISVTGFTDPLIVTSSGIPSAVAGAAYSTSLAAAGGTAPYTWSSTAGPAWLHLSADGVLTATPPASGTYAVTVQVADGVDSVTTRTVALVVEPAPVAPAAEVVVTVDVPVSAPVPTITTQPRSTPSTPGVLRSPLRTALAGLTVHSEKGAGFSRTRFPLVDANRDCQSTRVEVLLAESLSRPQFTRPTGCVVRSGKWFSSFDRRTVTSGQKVTAEYAVPLAEAWSSGARGWSAAKRRAYANDLGDRRTLVAVSTASATARGAREPTSWLPAPASRCSYVASWVAVKVRWGLTVDAAEKRRLVSLAASCPNIGLTVHRV